ncbi:DedA family protein [Serratia plymuthica]|jgi:membrane protein DedA with SNARE-associated domain|uniref:Inner membrane protein YghB n=3 Tax=Serratia plymuthica TaxID=82996 RepID=A0A318P0N1_SERPL|nr:DedA family protein [Serratia plymuthica]AGO57008.1 inner membrane protein YghB [Serratia plymuthica 4Rx13]AGP46058.1 membrane protein [Serratia plymuthica S13]AHY09264.1 membrane protein [Serratia plymuthica]ANJ94103.1 membrane protein [Serratia plymuthica]ANK00481.1 membrane protein [Serratia plymuthica]
MDVLREIVHALWQQDFIALADPSVIWVVYAVLFTTLFLENGLLPASFLPGDSLLLLSGALIAKGVMAFVPTLIILTLAASLGCWLSYLQGRWLGHTSLVKGWLLQLPAQYHQRAHNLFNRHGLMALMIGRFLGFVRTLLPTIAGISGLNSTRFHLFNWLSAAVWVGTLVSLGYAFSQIPLVKRYESQVMTGLMLLPLLLLLVGLLGAMLVIWRKKRASA